MVYVSDNGDIAYFFHKLSNVRSVIPAKAGIHLCSTYAVRKWIPAFAGMTVVAMSALYNVSRGKKIGNYAALTIVFQCLRASGGLTR